MAACLILTPDQDLVRSVETALSDKPICCIQFRTSSGLENENMLSDTVLVVIDAHFEWRFARDLLPFLEKQNLPILFISSTPENQKHLLKMYSGRCVALVYGCSLMKLSEAVNDLLETANETLTIGRLQLNTASQQVALDGSLVPLTMQEYRLLYILMRNPNSPLSRKELLKKAWGYPCDCITRTVDIHIGRLRKKIGTHWIETVHCLGYRLNTSA